MIELENTYIIKTGNIPIMFTAPHTMKQIKKDGIKHAEVFTKAIAIYVAKHLF